jgi:hypothetical protein
LSKRKRYERSVKLKMKRMNRLTTVVGHGVRRGC